MVFIHILHLRKILNVAFQSVKWLGNEYIFWSKKSSRFLMKRIRLEVLVFITNWHCAKYRNLIYFPGVKILWKGTVSSQFWENRPKLWGNCALPQNFYTRKFGEMTVFYAVWVVAILQSRRIQQSAAQLPFCKSIEWLEISLEMFGRVLKPPLA